MWDAGDGWRDALSGDHTQINRLAVSYDGRVTYSDDDPDLGSEIVDGTLTTSLMSGDTPQIAAELDITISDPTGELYTGLTSAPIGWWGHRAHIQSGVQAGDWESVIPCGSLRINSIQPSGGRPRLMPNGKWVRPAQTLTMRAVDLLDQVGDESTITPTSPPPAASVRSEVGRLCVGVVPVGSWTSAVGVPTNLAYDEHDRLGTITKLCRTAGLVPWIDRAGVLQVLPAAGSGDVWRIPLEATVEAVTSGSRDGVSNGWIVTSESDANQPLRGQALETRGVLRWGGPFGRVPSFAESPILKSNAQLAVAAATNRGSDMASRRQEVTVTCIADPAIDVLDTAVLILPDRTVDGLITRIVRPLTGGLMTVTTSVPMEVME